MSARNTTIGRKPRRPATALSPSRTKLTSLPAEIVTQISLHLDVATASSLARVSRYFRSLCDARIWEAVDFTVDLGFELALLAPIALNEKYSVLLSARARKIMRHASEQKLGKVKRVTMTPREGTSHILIKFLEGVASNLRELEVVGGPNDYTGASYIPDDHDMLDLRMLSHRLHFPHLTHLDLQHHTIRFIGFIGLLCEMAPNLTTIDLSVDQGLGQSIAPFPKFHGPGKIQRARLHCYWDLSRERTEDAIAILDLLGVSPQLSQLTLQYDSCEAEVDDHIVKVLGDHPNLRDFYWQHGMGDLGGMIARAEPKPAFTHLRRVVVPCNGWSDVFDLLLALPALEIIHLHRCMLDVQFIDRTSVLCPSFRSGFADPSPAQSMPPGFAAQLRRSPSLRIIDVLDTVVDEYNLLTFDRLDEIEKSENFTGYIRSIRHAGSELLHARMLLNQTWDSQAHTINGIEVAEELRGLIWHTDDQLEVREAMFPGEPMATWRNFTDFEGLVVPLSVIARMKEVEGGTADWEGRGIEVGEAAWQVLLDWKAGQEGVIGT